MSTISFGGLASGLDTGSIVSELVEIRRQPIYNLQTRIDSYNLQKTALTDMQTRLEALMGAAEALDSPQEFASLAAISSNEALASATAGSNAVPGIYDIQVNALATAQKSLSTGYDSMLTDVGTGLVSIGSGGESYSIVLEEGASTLADLRDAINASGAPVYASIMYDGSETGGYHLSLTAQETGTENTFTVGAGGLSGGAGLSLSTVTTASNAEILIDTLTITSQSNQISNAIQDVTLDLNSASPGTVFTLQVQTDPSLLEDQVQTFVDAYNDFYEFIGLQSAEGGTLRGNSLMRDLDNKIASMISSPAGGVLGDFTMMSQVGLGLSDDNLLEFDIDKFNGAVGEDFIAVRNLFAGNGTTDGIMDTLAASIDAMTDSVDGRFKIALDAITKRIDRCEDSIERYEKSVANYEELLNRKFSAMETIISQWNAQGNSYSALSDFDQE